MNILVLGSQGMVGSSVSKVLKKNKDINLFESSRKDSDLFSFSQTKKLFTTFKPDIVINAAAKVGGILANDLQRTEKRHFNPTRWKPYKPATKIKFWSCTLAGLPICLISLP